MKSQTLLDRLDIIFLILIGLMSPLFLFPQINLLWLFLPVPAFLAYKYYAQKRLFDRSPLDWAIVLLLIQSVVTLFIVEDIALSLPKVLGLFFGVLIFYGVLTVMRSPETIKWGVFVFLSAGTVLAVIGILGISKHDEPKYIRSLYDFLVSLPSINFGLPGAEAGFHPNALAGGLVLVLPLSFILLLPYLWKRAVEYRIFPRLWFAAPLSTCVLIIAAVILLTQSRSSFAGIFCVAWLLLFVGFRKKKMVIFTISALMVSGLAYVFFLAGTDTLPYTDLESRTKLIGRVSVFWTPAIQTINEHPLTGIGMNQARTLPQVGDDQAHLHNQFLHVGAEMGIPGLIAYLALLIIAASMCVRSWKRSRIGWMKSAALGLGCGVLAFFVFGFLDVIPLGAKVGVFFWFLLSLITAIYNVSLREASEINPGESPSEDRK